MSFKIQNYRFLTLMAVGMKFDGDYTFIDRELMLKLSSLDSLTIVKCIHD